MNIKHLISSLLVLFLVMGCDNGIETLQYRVVQLEDQLQTVKAELGTLKNQIEENSKFQKEMECQKLFDRIKKRWSNIEGCYYSSHHNTCMVKLMIDGKIQEAKIEDLQDD